jgi:hypothetical protein
LVGTGRKVLPCPGSPFRYRKDRGSAIAGREKKKIGRPKTGIGPNVGLRLYPDLDADIEAWIARQPDPKPSKPEAIRLLVRRALDSDLR